MICPLKFNSETLDLDGNIYLPKDHGVSICKCEEKKCAWWDIREGRCAILEISDSIYAIEHGMVNE